MAKPGKLLSKLGLSGTVATHPSGMVAEASGSFLALPDTCPPWEEWEKPEGFPDLAGAFSRGVLSRPILWRSEIPATAVALIRAAAYTEATRVLLIRETGMLGVAAVSIADPERGDRVVKGYFVLTPTDTTGSIVVPTDQLAAVLVAGKGAAVEAADAYLIVRVPGLVTYIARCPEVPRGELRPVAMFRKARGGSGGGGVPVGKLPADAWPNGPGDVDKRVHKT